MAETARIAILSAAEDAAWRDAAVAALPHFVPTRVALTPASVLDPGYPVLLIWTERAASRERVVRKLLGARRDVVLWRPDGAAAPAWLDTAWPVGPDMPARTLALVVRRVQEETVRAVSAPPRRRTSLALPAAASVAAAVLLGCVAMAAHWRDRPAAAAERAPLTELRGRQ